MAGVPWSDEEERTLRDAVADGLTSAQTASRLPGRSRSAVGLKMQSLALKSKVCGRPAATPGGASAGASAGARTVDAQQEVTDATREDGVRDLRAHGRRIRTIEDLLRHVEADMTRFEVATSEASKYEGLARDMDGEVRTHELFRVFVRLRPKSGPSTVELVESLVRGALKGRPTPAIRAPKPSRTDLWQVLCIADPHFGKYAWGRSTGSHDYDLGIAQRVVSDAAATLVAAGDAKQPARRTVALLGDQFHYDTPSGTTTGGTALDRDSRLQKMIEAGADTLLSVIELSAATCPTDVLLVNGNHDEALSWALQRIIEERFRKDGRVTVNREYTTRKYLAWGGNLIGFTHGDKAKKRLPQLMALERPLEWGHAAYREIHTGHFHQAAADRQQVIETVDGVLVRTAPALCPPDTWHAVEGYLGAALSMETFYYHKAGGLAGMDVARPWTTGERRAA